MDFQGFGQNQNDYGSPLVERIMTAEFNLGVAQGNPALAGGALTRLFGFWLAGRAGR